MINLYGELDRQISDVKNHVQKLNLEIEILKKELKRERECVDELSKHAIYRVTVMAINTQALRKVIL